MGDIRYLGIGEETTVGTPVSATDYIPIQSDRVTPDHRYLVMEDVSQRSYSRYAPGPFRNSGNIIMHLIPEGITKLFKWTLGDVSSSLVGTSKAYQHVFTESTPLKSFTARIGANLVEREIAGCFVNSVELAGSIDLAMATFSIVGGEETKQSIGSPTWPTYIAPFAFHGGSVSIGGSDKTSQVESVRIRINNNIPDRWTFGSRYETRSEVGLLVVDGELGLAFDDSDQYDAFLAGTEFALQVKWEGATIEDTYKYTVQIDTPKAVYQTDTVPHIDRREPIKITAPFRAYYKDDTDKTVKITVINTEETV